MIYYSGLTSATVTKLYRSDRPRNINSFQIIQQLNPDQNNIEKMDKLRKILILMAIIASNQVEGNVESGHWHCSNQFCIEKSYEKLELPPPNNGSTVHVIITPHILEIFEVN